LEVINRINSDVAQNPEGEGGVSSGSLIVAPILPADAFVGQELRGSADIAQPATTESELATFSPASVDRPVDLDDSPAESSQDRFIAANSEETSPFDLDIGLFDLESILRDITQ